MISSSNFLSNSATSGADIYLARVKEGYVRRSNFSSSRSTSTASKAGGSIGLSYCGSFEVSDCSFNQAKSSTYGGAIGSESTSLTVSRTFFEDCSSRLDGGSISVVGGEDVQIKNVVISRSTTFTNTSKGGSVSLDSITSSVEIQDSSISQSKGSYGGSLAMTNVKSTLQVRNLVVSESTAFEDGDIYVSDCSDVSISNSSFKNSNSSGGEIRIISTSENSPTGSFVLNNCLFENGSTALSSFSHSSSVNITNTKFISRKDSNSSILEVRKFHRNGETPSDLLNNPRLTITGSSFTSISSNPHHSIKSENSDMVIGYSSLEGSGILVKSRGSGSVFVEHSNFIGKSDYLLLDLESVRVEVEEGCTFLSNKTGKLMRLIGTNYAKVSGMKQPIFEIESDGTTVLKKCAFEGQCREKLSLVKLGSRLEFEDIELKKCNGVVFDSSLFLGGQEMHKNFLSSGILIKDTKIYQPFNVSGSLLVLSAVGGVVLENLEIFEAISDGDLVKFGDVRGGVNVSRLKILRSVGTSVLNLKQVDMSSPFNFSDLVISSNNVHHLISGTFPESSGDMTSMIISGGRLSNNTAKTILRNYHGRVQLKNFQVTGNTVSSNLMRSDGGKIHLANSTISKTILNASYSSDAEGLVHMEYGDIELSSSVMEDSPSRSCIKVIGGSVNIDNSSVLRNCHSAGYGGGVSMEVVSDRLSFSPSISGRFINCSAKYGGGGVSLRLQTSSVLSCVLSDAEFERCSSERGAAIFLKGVVLSVSSSLKFKNNNAMSGGGVFLDSSVIAKVISANWIFEGNSGKYGANVFDTGIEASSFSSLSSPPTSLKCYRQGNAERICFTDFKQLSNFKSHEFSTYPVSVLLKDGVAPIDVSSGLDFSVPVFSTDIYDQQVSEISGISLYLSTSDSTNNLVRTTSQNHQIPVSQDFKGVIMERKQDDNVVTSLSIYLLKVGESTAFTNITKIPVIVRGCPKGYFKVKRDEFYTCLRCPAGYYSVQTNANKCRKCPNHADCSDPSKVISKENYWGYENNGVYEVMYCASGKCQKNNTCRGDFDEKQPLCSVCKDGYSFWNGNCVECRQTNGGYVTLWIASILFQAFVTHINSQVYWLSTEKIFAFFGNIYSFALRDIEFSMLLDVMRPVMEFVFGMSFPAFSIIGENSVLGIKVTCPFQRDEYWYIAFQFLQPLFYTLVILIPFIFFLILYFVYLYCWCCCVYLRFSICPEKVSTRKDVKEEHEEDIELEEVEDSEESALEEGGGEEEDEKPKKNVLFKREKEKDDFYFFLLRSTMDHMKIEEEEKEMVVESSSSCSEEIADEEKKEVREVEEKPDVENKVEEEKKPESYFGDNEKVKTPSYVLSSSQESSTSSDPGTSSEESEDHSKTSEISKFVEKTEEEKDETGITEDPLVDWKKYLVEGMTCFGKRKTRIVKNPYIVEDSEESKDGIFRTCCCGLLFSIFSPFFSLDSYILTFCNLPVITYQVFVEMVVVYFSCEEIGGKRVMSSMTSVNCDSKEYQLLGILVYVVCIYIALLPLSMQVFLLLCRKKIIARDLKFLKRFGTIFGGYRNGNVAVWYEPYCMLRKFIIVFSIAFAVVHIGVSEFLVTFFLILSFYVHIRILPYRTVTENVLEGTGIGVIIVCQVVKLSAIYLDHPVLSVLIILFTFGPTFGLMMYFKLRKTLLLKYLEKPLFTCIGCCCCGLCMVCGEAIIQRRRRKKLRENSE